MYLQSCRLPEDEAWAKENPLMAKELMAALHANKRRLELRNADGVPCRQKNEKRAPHLKARQPRAPCGTSCMKCSQEKWHVIKTGLRVPTLECPVSSMNGL